jgi:hypothetical protein
MLEAVRIFGILELACRAVGIDYATFRRWMIKAKRAVGLSSARFRQGDYTGLGYRGGARLLCHMAG